MPIIVGAEKHVLLSCLTDVTPVPKQYASGGRIAAQLSSKCVSRFVRDVLRSCLTEGNVGLMSRDRSTTGQRTS